MTNAKELEMVVSDQLGVFVPFEWRM